MYKKEGKTRKKYLLFSIAEGNTGGQAGGEVRRLKWISFPGKEWGARQVGERGASLSVPLCAVQFGKHDDDLSIEKTIL